MKRQSLTPTLESVSLTADIQFESVYRILLSMPLRNVRWKSLGGVWTLASSLNSERHRVDKSHDCPSLEESISRAHNSLPSKYIAPPIARTRSGGWRDIEQTSSIIYRWCFVSPSRVVFVVLWSEQIKSNEERAREIKWLIRNDMDCALNVSISGMPT